MQAYTLPDGRVIKVGAERFMAAEIMFRPDLIDIEVPGVSESIFNCIQVSSGVTLTSLQELNTFRFQLLHRS